MRNTNEKIKFLNKTFLKGYQGKIDLTFKDGKYEFSKSNLSDIEAVSIVMVICEILFNEAKTNANDLDIIMLSVEMVSFMMEIQNEMERR